jgi:hypothetical protein
MPLWLLGMQWHDFVKVFGNGTRFVPHLRVLPISGTRSTQKRSFACGVGGPWARAQEACAETFSKRGHSFLITFHTKATLRVTEKLRMSLNLLEGSAVTDFFAKNAESQLQKRAEDFDSFQAIDGKLVMR